MHVCREELFKLVEQNKITWEHLCAIMIGWTETQKCQEFREFLAEHYKI